MFLCEFSIPQVSEIFPIPKIFPFFDIFKSSKSIEIHVNFWKMANEYT